MSFLNGFLLGMTLQLAVGPVFFAVLHKSIKEGAVEAFKMALGVTLTDAFYILLSFSGVAALLKLPFLNNAVRFLGAGLLVYFGLKYFKSKKEPVYKDGGNKKGSNTNSLIYGIKLTAINPLTILFWSGTLGALLAAGKLTGTSQVLLYSSGCIASTILFLGITSIFGSYILKLLDKRLLRALDYFAGIFLVAFGIRMFIQ